MAFKNGAYATVWTVEPVSDTMTKSRISTSKKNKQTGEYETDFSGFVRFVGANAASAARNLREKDRIKLGEVEVSNRYDKEAQKEYTNFTVFTFDLADSHNTSAPAPAAAEEKTEETEDLPF